MLCKRKLNFNAHKRDTFFCESLSKSYDEQFEMNFLMLIEYYCHASLGSYFNKLSFLALFLKRLSIFLKTFWTHGINSSFQQKVSAKKIRIHRSPIYLHVLQKHSTRFCGFCHVFWIFKDISFLDRNIQVSVRNCPQFYEVNFSLKFISYSYLVQK